MFLPIGDAPRSSAFRPQVTWLLIALNVAVYLVVTLPLSSTAASLRDPGVLELLARGFPHPSAYDLFLHRHGFKPGAPALADLFASLFLHANFAHLAGNMLFLWIYGHNVEQRLGRVRFLLAYLLAGVVATWSFALFAGDSLVPLVGASGAISGVLGLYFFLCPRHQVRLFVFLFPFVMNVVQVPARWVIGFYLIVQNLFPLLLGAQSQVAYGAHLGGFLGGAAFALVLLRRRAPLAPPVERSPPPASPRLDAHAEALRDAVRRGDRAEAFARLPGSSLEELTRALPDEALVIAEWCAAAHDPGTANELVRRVLGAHRASELDQARVYLVLGLTRLAEGQLTAAHQHLLAVFDFDPEPEVEERARSALATVRALGGRPRPDIVTGR